MTGSSSRVSVVRVRAWAAETRRTLGRGVQMGVDEASRFALATNADSGHPSPLKNRHPHRPQPLGLAQLDVQLQVAVPAGRRIGMCNSELQFPGFLERVVKPQVAPWEFASCGNCNLELHIPISGLRGLCEDPMDLGDAHR